MKKRTILFHAVLVFAAMFMVSCDKDSEDDNVKDSKLTAEQHKSKINDIGVSFIDDMDDMSAESMIEVVVNFFALADEHDLDDEIDMKSAPMAYMRQYTALQENSLKALSLKSFEDDDYESVTEVYNDLTGIYTYNATSEVWTKTQSADEIVFNFPSKESQTENDAQLRVYDFLAEPADLQEFEDYTYERLNSLKIDLKVNSNVLFSYHMSASYFDDDMPKKMTSEVSMETYSWLSELDMTNRNSAVKAFTKYKKGSSVIMEAGLTANGNFTYDNIDQDVLSRENDDEEDVLDDQDILTSGTIYYQIENLRAEGEIDAVNFIADVNAADEMPDETDADEKAYTEAIAKAFNDHASLKLMYANEKEVIARAEMIVIEEDDSWGEYVDYDYYTDLRFVFTDGTGIDDSYFENGFSTIIDRMNEMIQKVNREHDVDIEEIEE